MAEIDDLVMQVERLEIDNKRLTTQLKIANREINRCWRTINRYQKMIEDESEHFSKCANYLKTYSDNIQKLYEQGK